MFGTCEKGFLEIVDFCLESLFWGFEKEEEIW
jgi:hypothetical protein